VTWIVNTSLDAMTEVNTELGGLGLQFVVKAWVGNHNILEEGRVVGKIWKRCWHVATSEGNILLSADIFRITATELDPLWELLNRFWETGWWII
jgi:hypothetical protein